MGHLTIVGLGPGRVDELTVNARDLLLGSPEIVVSTMDHPVVHWLESLGRRAILLGSLLGPRGQEAIESAAATLLESVRRQESTILATPGHPPLDYPLIRSIAKTAELSDVGVSIVSGISYLEASLQAGAWPASTSLQVVSTPDLWPQIGSIARLPDERVHDPFRGVYRVLDPTRPTVVGPLYQVGDLRQVITWLRGDYRDNDQVQAISFDRDDGNRCVVTMRLGDLDWNPTWLSLCLVLPPIERLADLPSFDTLRYIVARLRAPTGCPWDREQDYDSVKKHLIEETYEAIAALEDRDFGRFAEELGDVLLQVVMYAQFGREAGDFDLEDVLGAVTEKLIRRHPHVFGDVSVSSSAEVLRNWERIKQTERKGGGSNFGGVPEAAPALIRADAIQSRAARLGWVEAARTPAPIGISDGGPERRATDFGTLLFDIVALARQNHVDPEAALRLATNRFRDAVDLTLAEARERGSPLESQTVEERWRGPSGAREIFRGPEDAANPKGDL